MPPSAEKPLNFSYHETLADYCALPEKKTEEPKKTVNLLSITVDRESANCCWDCISWIGRCLKGKRNVIAADYACPEFQSRKR